VSKAFTREADDVPELPPLPRQPSSLRPHYAHTLWHWSDRLEAHAEAARRIVGEQKFRVWRIYMAGAAHAFGRGWLSIHQVLAGKPRDDGSIGYPYTRDHLLT
jgi:cyclopropane-fatty-acyl-phospholipid synthase